MKSPVQLGHWIHFSDLTPGMNPPAGVEELELWDKQDNKRKVLQFGRPSKNLLRNISAEEARGEYCLQWYSIEILSGHIGNYPEAILMSQHLATGRYSHWRYAVPPYDLHQIHPCSEFEPRVYLTSYRSEFTHSTLVYDTQSCSGEAC